MQNLISREGGNPDRSSRNTSEKFLIMTISFSFCPCAFALMRCFTFSSGRSPNILSISPCDSGRGRSLKPSPNNNNNNSKEGDNYYYYRNQDSQNRARQGSWLVEDVNPTHKYHRSLSHDKEIESFIKTRRGSQKKNKMDDEADDDDDDDTQTQSFTEYLKKQQQQASTSTSMKDSDQSSSSSENEEDDDDDDDELQELASTKNNKAMNKEKMMSGSDHNVDKKADEFIAKFREQIRLQRIASIRTKTTTTQAKTKPDLPPGNYIYI
ncbi:alpha/beta hydrolases superfamily protein [Tanacetum coccineum]